MIDSLPVRDRSKPSASKKRAGVRDGHSNSAGAATSLPSTVPSLMEVESVLELLLFVLSLSEMTFRTCHDCDLEDSEDLETMSEKSLLGGG